MKYKFKKPERSPILEIFIHCSDSDLPEHDNIETITKWHVEDNGWDYIGYHLVFTQDGEVHPGRSLEIQPAAQYPFNRNTIAVCLTGRHSFSDAQKKSLRAVCKQINKAYDGAVRFRGHKEVDPDRTCPNFDYKECLGLDDYGFLLK